MISPRSLQLLFSHLRLCLPIYLFQLIFQVNGLHRRPTFQIFLTAQHATFLQAMDRGDFFLDRTSPLWDRGSAMVKVLCCNSGGRLLDPSWCHWNFSLT